MPAGVLDSLIKHRPNGGMLQPLTHQSIASTNLHGHGRPALHFIGASLAVAGFSALAAAWLMPDAGIGAPLTSLAAMALVAFFGARGLVRAHPYAQVGLANLVTLARAGIAALVAGALWLPAGLADRPVLAWALVGIVAIGLALDGVDGWLARRSGLVSGFGARFDMEVDAALAALLCSVAILSDKAGLWLLPLGFLRYLWVVAGLILPWLTANLPDRLSRKAICVLQIGVLTALIAPVVVHPWSTLIAIAALAALLWSFAVDALWLWQRR